MTFSLRSTQAYRGALALNNVGVSLLERGYYKQAVITLRDGVAAMKCACYPVDDVQVYMSVDENVNRAYKCLHLAKETKLMSQELSLKTVFFDYSLIPFLTHRDHSQPSECFRPTRIEVPDSASGICLGDRDQYLETVLMMCNLALSHYLLSRATIDQCLARKQFEEAQTVFGLAANLISSRFAVCVDEFEEASLLTVDLLLTGNLVQSLRETNCLAEDSPHLERRRLIQEAIENSEITGWCRRHINTAAPAA